jgi:hypothetical protein
MIKQLKALKIEVDASDPKEADVETVEGEDEEEISHRYVAHAE